MYDKTADEAGVSASDQSAAEERPSPEYTAKNAWTVYDGAEREKAMAFCDDYLAFLTGCKTERETIACCEKYLREHGFGSDPAGDAYVTTLRGKALFAFRRGTQPLSAGIRLVAAHADCPRLDFKPHPFVEQTGFAQAKTHYYGGLRKYQWLARPLALHGVICKDNGEVVPVCLGEEPGEPVFTIADLLPHLAQKQVTQTVKDAFEGEKLNVILGSRPAEAGDGDKVPEPVKAAVLKLLQDKYDVREEDFLSAEIEVVPAGGARYVGLDRSLIGAYGQDDRICVYTGMRALTDSAAGDGANCALMLWDKEEIGSDGATGASSRFMKYCIEEVLAAHEPQTPLGRVMLASSALSADVTAGMDPDYQEAHEKNNAANLGYGPCFEKYTGSGGKYGASEAH
ncbi:MAG: aminopeptidase, partial [Desulfovibrionaceae bacterium]|nr:aminopeptidase [Desulfovibrionaceae bacterium]